jgi:hypothetical protein
MQADDEGALVVDHVKVEFRTPSDDGTEKVETMWAMTHGSHYIVDNIPFHAYSVAVGDVIEVHEEHGMLVFQRVIQESGNSTLRIRAQKTDLDEIRKTVAGFSAGSEWYRPEPQEPELVLIAVDVTWETDVRGLKKYLDDGQAAGDLTYEEACVGETWKAASSS